MRILPARGRESKGKLANHGYELFLSVAELTHTTPQAYSPQSHGMCERFNKTMKQAFFATALRKKLYTSLTELPSDLDAWLCSYNAERLPSGKYCYGKTPLEPLMDSKGLAIAKHTELMFNKEVADREQLTDKQVV